MSARPKVDAERALVDWFRVQFAESPTEGVEEDAMRGFRRRLRALLKDELAKAADRATKALGDYRFLSTAIRAAVEGRKRK